MTATLCRGLELEESIVSYLRGLSDTWVFDEVTIETRLTSLRAMQGRWRSAGLLTILR